MSSNKKLIELVRYLRARAEEGRRVSGGKNPDSPRLDEAASALEEREGLEAALREFLDAFTHATRVDGSEDDWAEAYRKERAVRAALNPPPIEKAGTPDQAEIPNLRDVIAVRADLWPKRFPARTDPAPTQPSGGGE